MRSSQPSHVPNELIATYYAQLASDEGLILTEATQISLIGKSYPVAPVIHSQEQVERWKKVVEAVHASCSFIFLQLWHVLRISHNSLHPEEGLPVAPSTITPADTTFSSDFQRVPFETPLALETAELPMVLAQYRVAAEMPEPQTTIAWRFTRRMAICSTNYYKTTPKNRQIRTMTP